MSALREKYDAYMARWCADDRNTVCIICPHCHHAHACPAPDTPDETWDTLALCPDCEGMYMRITTQARGLAVAPTGAAA
jgi:hypothetical protein